MKKIFYYFWVRNKWRDLRKKCRNLTADEKRLIHVVRYCLQNSKTKLFITPPSIEIERRYINYESGDIFIIIEEQRTIVCNHKYQYNLNISRFVHYYLCKKFDKLLYSKTSEIETEMIDRRMDSLDRLVLKMKNKLKDEHD